MEKENDKWIKNIKGRLENHSEPVSNKLWERIESEIRRTPEYNGERSFFASLSWMHYVAASIVILLGIGIGLHMAIKDSSDSEVKTESLPSNISASAEISAGPDTLTKRTAKKIYSSEDSAPKTALAHRSNTSSTSEALHARTTVTTHDGIGIAALQQADSGITVTDSGGIATHRSIATTIATTAKNDITVADKKIGSDENAAKNNIKVIDYSKNINENKYLSDNYEPDYKKDKKYKNSGMSLSAYGKFSGMKSLGSNTDDAVLYQSDVNFTNTSPGLFLAHGGILPSDIYANEKYNYNYDFPVSFGIAFNIPIYKNLSIESGVIFTKLNTHIENDNSSSQKLWYAGIPLKFYYPVYKGNNFDIYSSFGGTIEKCFSAKYSGSFRVTALKNIPLQYSANISVGAQYNISQLVALYVEPGFAYYFKEAQTPETYRKKHPASISLNGGIRFHF